MKPREHQSGLSSRHVVPPPPPHLYLYPQEENRLGSTALEALGWLSLGASELMEPFTDKLIPLIITSIQGSASVDRKEVQYTSIGLV